ncbi:MAG: CBS domain-containing protein [Planctomycetota bacterium]
MSDGIPDFYDAQVPLRAFVTKRLIGVDADDTVQEAARRMSEFNISSVTVVKDDDIVGLLTDTDLKTRVVARGRTPETPVREVMTSDLVSVDIGTPVHDALVLMAKQDIKHLLVKENDAYVGMVTFRDFIDMELHSLETYISRE